MQNMTLETMDKQEAKVIYTKDMMDYEINVYGTEEEPLFLMRDVNNWLEAKGDPSQLARLVDDEDRKLLKVEGSSGRSQLLITEDGLYEICMRSSLPKAKKVRKFIKSILKELRTNGYVTTTNSNNSEIVSAMTMIAQSLQPMQQALVSMQQNIELSRKEQEEFRDTILEEQYTLQAKTQVIENTLNFLRIDGYELKTLTLVMAQKREGYRKYFNQMVQIYRAKETQISKVWDYIIYSRMYKHIGREKITPFSNKSIHVNQSIKDITKDEYPKCIDFIETFSLDKVDFELRLKESYGYRNIEQEQINIKI